VNYMRLQTFFIVCFLGLFTAGFVLYGVSLWRPDPFRDWGRDLDDATGSAAENDRPLLIYFTDERDPHRKQLAEEIFRDPDVSRFLAENVQTALVDLSEGASVGSHREYAEQLLVEGTPVLILLGPDGKERARMVGYFGTTPEGFLIWMQRALADNAGESSG